MLVLLLLVAYQIITKDCVVKRLRSGSRHDFNVDQGMLVCVVLLCRCLGLCAVMISLWAAVLYVLAEFMGGIDWDAQFHVGAAGPSYCHMPIAAGILQGIGLLFATLISLPRLHLTSYQGCIWSWAWCISWLCLFGPLPLPLSMSPLAFALCLCLAICQDGPARRCCCC
ncbi:hypothetical protein U1Q18_011147 [Sarracenia purpurea var. burkii]